ncbi:hypothetical protein M422DRAFT_68525 [Sphaerobolus stellatus SS14]|uniref:Uncharacterized protein n=1 Tax=Sphaerobolus stellatus (strain SS14) TaxID=990650 RepID=A0A0C9VRJ1_SPHS4|nr:hypothetical protein M422DRAFT_68525 [Sphaerobolus stellatus SS14]
MINLPIDLWSYLAESFIQRQDLLNLSVTCKDIWVASIPIIFQTVIFQGFDHRKQRTFPICFAHILHTKSCIAHYAQNPAITSAIHEVKIKNWSGFNIPIWVDFVSKNNYDSTHENSVFHHYPMHVESIKSLREEFTALFIAICRDLLDLLVKLPNLKRIHVFEEYGMYGNSRYLPDVQCVVDGCFRFPTRYGYPKINYIIFDATKSSGRTTVLPIPSPRSQGVDRKKPISEWLRYHVDILEETTLPILAFCLQGDVLARISPSAVQKLFSANRIIIDRCLLGTQEPACIPVVQRIIDGIDSRPLIEFRLLNWLYSAGQEVELQMLEALRLPQEVNRLRTYGGPARLLPTLYTLNHSIENIHVMDLRWEDVVNAGIMNCPVDGRRSIRKLNISGIDASAAEGQIMHHDQVAEIWPCVVELTIRWHFDHGEQLAICSLLSSFSVFRELKTLILRGDSALIQEHAFNLATYLSPPISSVQRIYFRDLSLAFWNSEKEMWEFEMNIPTYGHTYPEETKTEAMAIIDRCWKAGKTVNHSLGQSLMKTVSEGVVSLSRTFTRRHEDPILEGDALFIFPPLC